MASKYDKGGNLPAGMTTVPMRASEAVLTAAQWQALLVAPPTRAFTQLDADDLDD